MTFWAYSSSAVAEGDPREPSFACRCRVPLLALDGTNVKVTMESGNVVLFGTVAKLTETAATALNGAFKTQAIPGRGFHGFV